jgi:DNA topoisomerase-1
VLIFLERKPLICEKLESIQNPKKPIFARIGRYGPMLQLGETESEEKPKFASIPKDKSIETITLEEALPLFALPRVVGQNKDGEEVITQIGRFGPYIKSGKTFVSIKQEEIFSITLKEALAKVEEKETEAKNKIIQEFKDSDIQVLNGRYGPYITNGKKNAKIPKDSDPKKLTLEECQKLIDEAPEKKKEAGDDEKNKITQPHKTASHSQKVYFHIQLHPYL